MGPIDNAGIRKSPVGWEINIKLLSNTTAQDASVRSFSEETPGRRHEHLSTSPPHRTGEPLMISIIPSKLTPQASIPTFPHHARKRAKAKTGLPFAEKV